jgi:3-methyladenine DNA glycosylase AlkD
MAARKIRKNPRNLLPQAPLRTRTEPGVREVLAWFERQASPVIKAGMARYAIPSARAFGISVGSLRTHAKRLGRNHQLALALWATDLYEARMLATFLDDPELVTPAQMDAWGRDFDSWSICDTACFHLFDRTPHALGKVPVWARSREEFVKRAAFALLASLTVHDKEAPDEFFAKGLQLIETAAEDDRNFVAKAVNWALRSIGKRNAVRALSQRQDCSTAKLDPPCASHVHSSLHASSRFDCASMLAQPTSTELTSSPFVRQRWVSAVGARIDWRGSRGISTQPSV